MVFFGWNDGQALRHLEEAVQSKKEELDRKMQEIDRQREKHEEEARKIVRPATTAHANPVIPTFLVCSFTRPRTEEMGQGGTCHL